MADKEALQKNIDKISYGVGGLLAVVVIALPFVLTGGIDATASKIQSDIEKLEDRIRSPDNPELEKVPEWSKEIARVWQAPIAEDSPSWVSMPRPALLKKFDTTPPPQAVHSAPCVASISCLRDADKQKAFLRVSVRMGSSNAHVRVTKVGLERRVDDGDWVAVPDIEDTDDFEWDDFGVEAGKKYAYRVSTRVAVGDPVNGKAPIPPADDELTSAPLATSDPIPNDVSLILRGSGFVGTIDPQIVGEIRFWSYEKGEVERIRAGASTPWSRRFEFGPEVEGGKKRYELYRIIPEQNLVEVRDNATGDRLRFDTSARSHLTIEPWPAVSGDCDDAGDAGDASAEEAPVDAFDAGAAVDAGADDAGADDAGADDAGADDAGADDEGSESPSRPRFGGGRRGFGN